MRPTLRRTALALACVCPALAPAMTLSEAFEAARNHDAQYRASSFELESTRQNATLARSALRPSVVLQASTSNVSGTREFPNSLNQNVRLPVDYNAPQITLQARAPLYNGDALARVKQTDAQIEAAEATFDARAQDLAERVTTAYLQALVAQEAVSLARADITSLQSQRARALQRMERGEGTRTEIAQTQASMDQAQVRLLDALDQATVAQRALRRLTGVETLKLQRVADGFMPPAPQPARLAEWMERAERDNPSLRARRLYVEAARLGIERARAGHLPRADLVASLGRSSNESISNLNQTSTLRSVGVQLSIPLYSGGATEAGIKQSMFDRDRTQEELRNERESVQLELHRNFYTADNSLARVEAQVRALASSELAQQGMTRAQAAGLATQTDVLDSIARRYAAARDLAQARYEYLASRLRLMLLAGVPAIDTIHELDRALPVESQLETRVQP